jgi:phosphodiesterase/alkaline phosphatase D-like protein
MPRRLAGLYGSLPLGGAELFVLDSRQYRCDQPRNPTDAALSEPCPPTTTDDPSRTLLGPSRRRG